MCRLAALAASHGRGWRERARHPCRGDLAGAPHSGVAPRLRMPTRGCMHACGGLHLSNWSVTGCSVRTTWPGNTVTPDSVVTAAVSVPRTGCGRAVSSSNIESSTACSVCESPADGSASTLRSSTAPCLPNVVTCTHAALCHKGWLVSGGGPHICGPKLTLSSVYTSCVASRERGHILVNPVVPKDAFTVWCAAAIYRTILMEFTGSRCPPVGAERTIHWIPGRRSMVANMASPMFSSPVQSSGKFLEVTR